MKTYKVRIIFHKFFPIGDKEMKTYEVEAPDEETARDVAVLLAMEDPLKTETASFEARVLKN